MKYIPNPCFNGILKYGLTKDEYNAMTSLNPCFNGILKYLTQAQLDRLNVLS